MRTVFQLFLLTLISASLFGQNVKWEKTTINFGTVKDWNSPAANFKFTNTGTERLMFLPQRHDREVLVRYPNRAIRPGESGVITIMYYTGNTGVFSRMVEVFSNASGKAEKLTVKGNIKSIYADALTQCPSFQTASTPKTGEPNVVQAVDEQTNRPIPGTQIEIFDRGIRKAINGTNVEGVAVNWVEPGKYIAVGYKEGYEKAEEEVVFTKRNRSHVIYLKRNVFVEEPVLVIDEPVQELEITEPIELGITTNQVLREETVESESLSKEPEEQFDLGISTNNQWEEPSQVEEEVPEYTEEFDLGISFNEHFSDEVTVDSSLTQAKEVPPAVIPAEERFDLGINLNEQLESESVEAQDGEQISNSENIEQLVEAALAEAEVKPEPATEVIPSVEPEFAETTFKPNNVLLLLDVSGSMRDGGKMDKLKASINRLVTILREVDVLTMIAYNSNSWELLPPTPVKDNEGIMAIVDSLVPFGYTNGVKGMESAYESLEKQLIDGGNNQLIIATDGKFNSSKFSEKDAIQLVKSNKDKGIVLSIIGFGEDKEAARLMRRLADLGEGSFLRVKNNEDPTELLADEIKLRSRK